MKRFQANGKKIITTDLTVLTDSQFEKLENPDLRDKINAIAKDLHVDWAVEVNGNCNQLALSRTLGPVVSDSDTHELEMTSIQFTNSIDKLEYRKPEDDDKQNSEEWKPGKEEVEFAKDVLQRWDETEEEYGITGATLLCGRADWSINLPCGRISENMLKCMFETFLEKYVYET